MLLQISLAALLHASLLFFFLYSETKQCFETKAFRQFTLTFTFIFKKILKHLRISPVDFELQIKYGSSLQRGSQVQKTSLLLASSHPPLLGTYVQHCERESGTQKRALVNNMQNLFYLKHLISMAYKLTL